MTKSFLLPISGLGLALLVSSACSSQQAQADSSKGKVLFEQCEICHAAQSAEVRLGPSLQGLFKKPKLEDGADASEPNVRAKIDKGGDGMPAYADTLTAQEKDDLIAFLKTL